MSEQASLEDLKVEYEYLSVALSEMEKLPPSVHEDPMVRDTFNEGLSRKQELEKFFNFSQQQGDNLEVS